VRSPEPTGTAALRPEGGRIVLLAGRMKGADRTGHHDYLAGCALLASLLRRTGVEVTAVREGWPDDERILDAARSLVFYTRGAGKQEFLGSAQRVERLQELVDRGVGIVMIHQALSYPPEWADRALQWLGGAHLGGRSGRGHWWTHHRDFPEHPTTRGVLPWRIRDGWLNGIEFADAGRGIVPLVWSGRRHRGSSEGGTADVVGWAYERPGGGRSFCFTGLDAHSAWSRPGVRRLLVNGILWSAGLDVPAAGAECSVSRSDLRGYLTPRSFRGRRLLRGLLRALGRRR
jgi:hypothetical protein